MTDATGHDRVRYVAGLGALAAGLALGAAGLAGLLPAWDSAITEACGLYFDNGAVLGGVPVARTAAQQARGLSHRDDAGPGMLFTYSSPEPRIFRMRDTRIPLTIGFFAADGELFAVEDMEPHSDTYHFSLAPALDALELAPGQFEAHGLAVGSRLLRRECYPTQDE